MCWIVNISRSLSKEDYAWGTVAVKWSGASVIGAGCPWFEFFFFLLILIIFSCGINQWMPDLLHAWLKNGGNTCKIVMSVISRGQTRTMASWISPMGESKKCRPQGLQQCQMFNMFYQSIIKKSYCVMNTKRNHKNGPT